MKKKGVLLVNLGTPRTANISDVRAYLREFLMDPEVITLPFLVRWVLVNALIAPLRGPKSAALYQKIWSPEGSPLELHTRDLATKLQEALPNLMVRFAFRYGMPNLESILNDFEAAGTEDLLILPLFPQYATSTTRTIEKELIRLRFSTRFLKTCFVQSFFDRDFYIHSVAHQLRGLSRDNHLLFSFHGLPESHLTAQNPDCAPCLTASSCTKKLNNCYRAQCFETAKKIVHQAEWIDLPWSVSFQSRLGRGKWLLPSTETSVKELAARGTKNLAILAPGFVSDCLETLEELDHQVKEGFFSAGGKEFNRISCLNADPLWVKNLSQWIETTYLNGDSNGTTSS